MLDFLLIGFFEKFYYCSIIPILVKHIKKISTLFTNSWLKNFNLKHNLQIDSYISGGWVICVQLQPSWTHGALRLERVMGWVWVWLLLSNSLSNSTFWICDSSKIGQKQPKQTWCCVHQIFTIGRRSRLKIDSWKLFLIICSH